MDVSLVIPTRNESSNIKTLLRGVWDIFVPYAPEIKYEVVVVDDSSDNTPIIARKSGASVVKGKGLGLGQAIIDGINSAKYEIVVVMDADLSHSPEAILSLVKPIMNHGYDLVIGSRYVKGGDFSDWALDRKIKSIIGVKLMLLVTGVKDSNSGFFAFRKSILNGVELKPQSWKIMLEILFKGNWIAKMEAPITFNDRVGGVSKNSNAERVKHAKHLLRLLVWKWSKFIKFACVGGIGALWYFATLFLLTEYVDIWYGWSAIIGTVIALTNNYFINHYYTFKKEKAYNNNLFKGWVKYGLNSAVGDGVDWCILVFMTEIFGVWYMLSAFIASGVAAVIKYSIANKFIWGKKGKKASDADYEWHSYFKGMPWQKMSKQKIARVVREYASEAGITVDVGAGSSPLGIMVDHSDYIGIDLNKDKMEYMRGKQLNRCQFIEGSVLSLPFKDEYADTVLFIETIEHLNSLEEIDRALKELVRVLKQNGRLIIAMPDFSSLAGRIMEKLYGKFYPQAYADDHKVKLDALSLSKLCFKQGFALERGTNLFKRDVVMSFRKL